MRAENVKLRDVLQRRLQQARRVGRVQQDQVELLPQGGEILHGVSRNDPRPAAQAGQLQILPDQLHGIRPPVHEYAPLRPAAERLDAKLAGPGE